jgi:hypothetical protein
MPPRGIRGSGLKTERRGLSPTSGTCLCIFIIAYLPPYFFYIQILRVAELDVLISSRLTLR